MLKWKGFSHLFDFSNHSRPSVSKKYSLHHIVVVYYYRLYDVKSRCDFDSILPMAIIGCI